MLNLKLKSMKTIKLLAILFIATSVFTACSDDDHVHGGDDHEGEVITTVIYTLTNTTNSADTVVFTYTDLDGEGGADGTSVTVGNLKANATYTGSIQLLNATENPADDITKEVKEESNEHEFFYTNTAGLTITKTDKDKNNNPLGVDTTVAAGAAGNGTLTVVLKHEPTKPNDGTAAGAGGSTDVEVTFDVTIQ